MHPMSHTCQPLKLTCDTLARVAPGGNALPGAVAGAGAPGQARRGAGQPVASGRRAHGARHPPHPAAPRHQQPPRGVPRLLQ